MKKFLFLSKICNFLASSSVIEILGQAHTSIRNCRWQPLTLIFNESRPPPETWSYSLPTSSPCSLCQWANGRHRDQAGNEIPCWPRSDNIGACNSRHLRSWVWMSLNGIVYDISNFVHPGGAAILAVGGKAGVTLYTKAFNSGVHPYTIAQVLVTRTVIVRIGPLQNGPAPTSAPKPTKAPVLGLSTPAPALVTNTKKPTARTNRKPTVCPNKKATRRPVTTTTKENENEWSWIGEWS